FVWLVRRHAEWDETAANVTDRHRWHARILRRHFDPAGSVHATGRVYSLRHDGRCLLAVSFSAGTLAGSKPGHARCAFLFHLPLHGSPRRGRMESRRPDSTSTQSSCCGRVTKTPSTLVSYKFQDMDDESTRADPTKESSDDVFAARLRGFGPVGLLAILIIFLGNWIFLPGSALLVLLWRHLSHTPWREIGFVRPRSWIRTVTLGILFGVAFKFLMKSIVMPLLGADPINQPYHYLQGNRAVVPMTLYAMIIGAGFG